MKSMKELLSEMTLPINDEYNKFDDYLTQSMLTDVKLINTVVQYIVKRKGKRFRPRLCLLSAKMCGDINENTFRASSLIEMIHVATLIHDDVVDEADKRRGWPSVGREFGKIKLQFLLEIIFFQTHLAKCVILIIGMLLKCYQKQLKD